MEPAFQSDEKLITRLDGAFRGRWNQTWITNKGLHLRQWGGMSFIPYTRLSGVISQGLISKRVFSKSREDPCKTLEFYVGTKRVTCLSLDRTTADKVKGEALESKLKSIPRSALTKELDEAKLLEVVSNSLEARGGLFTDKVGRLTKRGIIGIEKFLGEDVRIFGGKYNYLLRYFSNPEFISKNWIIEVRDYDPWKNCKPSVTTIYRPDIVFFYADLLFREETSSSSGSSGGHFSSGSSPSSGPSYILLKESSSVTLCTPYGKKQFSPFKVFGYCGSKVPDLVKA